MSTPSHYEKFVVGLIQIFGFENKPNFTLNPATRAPNVPAGETIIMKFTDPIGQDLFFTTNGFTAPGHGYIPYKSVCHATWPSFMKGRELDYEEYILFSFRDRPSISVHAGKGYACLLGAFVKMIGREINQWECQPVPTPEKSRR